MNESPASTTDHALEQAVQHVESRPGHPWGAWLFALGGLALLATAASTSNPHWAIAGAAPLLIALALWLSRPRPFAAVLTEEGLELSNPHQLIRYEDMEGVRPCGLRKPPAKQTRASFPIAVFHKDGVLLIPARLTLRSAELYHALCRLVSPGGDRNVAPALVEYLQREEEHCGADAVCCYRVRSWRCTSPANRRRKAVSLALIATSFVWAGAATAVSWATGKEAWGWFAAGFWVLPMSLVCFVAFWLSARVRKRVSQRGKWPSLVVGPNGLALLQGDMRGQLRWDEVLDVKIGHCSRGLYAHRTTVGPAITLRVEGATIAILDIYDRPLNVIYKVIRRYWG